MTALLTVFPILTNYGWHVNFYSKGVLFLMPVKCINMARLAEGI